MGVHSPSLSQSTFTQLQSVELTTSVTPDKSGNNASQYKTVAENIDVIVRFLATKVNPQQLADKLNQAGLINDYIKEKVSDSMTGVTISEKIKTMIDAVLSRIQLKATNYDKFVAVLTQLGSLEDLIEYIAY